MLEAFVQQSHIVLGCARSVSIVQELTSQFPHPHHFQVVDVSHENEVSQWSQNILPHYKIDLILNNAAIINKNNPLWEIDPQEFSQLVDINIKGTFYVLRYFLPSMISRKQGVVVNFSSGWGRSTSPEVAPYCASKWAIEGMTQSLAQEIPAGMCAVAFNPGVIQTEMLTSCFGASSSLYPTPQEWAKKAVPYLLRIGPQENGLSLSCPGAE